MTEAKVILVAEDDASIRLGLVDTLESEGYDVLEAVNGEEAVTLFHEQSPDLVLLDIMMPRLSGYDVCREIRKHDVGLPVLMLSAKSEEIDKVLGLELGADDYITKPFGVRELLARVSAALRRSNVQGGREAPVPLPERIAFGLTEIDTARRQLWREGEEVMLTQLEYKLMIVFHENPDRALSRDFLLNTAWGMNYLGTTRTLDQHVSQLRRKVEINSAKPQYLLTVHGYGYRYQPSAD